MIWGTRARDTYATRYAVSTCSTGGGYYILLVTLQEKIVLISKIFFTRGHRISATLTMVDDSTAT